MSAQPGWYPDPGGGKGLYRYWDGRAWSAATTANPHAAPPNTSLTGAATPTRPTQPTAPGQPGSGQQGYGQQGYGQGAPGQPGGAYAAYRQGAKKGTPVGWWIGAGVLIVTLIVVGVLVIRSLSTGEGPIADPQGGQGTQDICPEPDTSAPPPGPQQQDPSRVYGGPVSYPRLPSPWSPPQGDNRVPFGTDVAVQQVVIEENYQPGSSWVASVLIGRLNAGDGFYTPEQGSEIVVKCILGSFYGNNEVQSDVQKNQATKIDGHDAWLVESQLHFDIEGLQAKGELLIVTIIATGAEDGSAGLFYASIPDNAPELVAPAREALKNLTVD
ncbi:MAG TPA: DUF2510 domain-containing protein [Microlunatus sp.]|nr:DUF2510 domain-containing protein [Microlunatus sp.]